jgi:MinD superfamily P-loop ATPase
MGENNIKIAVLSGKGGTGKTLVSVNLAAVADRATYIDCDVEEPNGHLFFKPQSVSSQEVTVKIPVVNEELCTGCKTCVEFCKFNALSYINNRLLIFTDICHSCGGCILFCPEKALVERDKVIGVVKKGTWKHVNVWTGELNTGEPVGIPIIQELLKNIKDIEKATLIDCPPGSACVVMESIQDADYCILVAEPTLFGVHNLNMVYELVKLFKKPHGVVLNKCQEGDNPAEQFCLEKGIKILGRIAFDQELGFLNSKGQIVAEEDPTYQKLFSLLLERVREEVHHETITNS